LSQQYSTTAVQLLYSNERFPDQAQLLPVCHELKLSSTRPRLPSSAHSSETVSLRFLTATAPPGPSARLPRVTTPNATQSAQQLAHSHTVTHRGKAVTCQLPSRTAAAHAHRTGTNTLVLNAQRVCTQTRTGARIRTSGPAPRRVAPESRVPPSRGITGCLRPLATATRGRRRGRDARGGRGRNRERHSPAASSLRSRAREGTEEAVGAVVQPPRFTAAAGALANAGRLNGGSACVPLGAIPGAVGPRR